MIWRGNPLLADPSVGDHGSFGPLPSIGSARSGTPGEVGRHGPLIGHPEVRTGRASHGARHSVHTLGHFRWDPQLGRARTTRSPAGASLTTMSIAADDLPRDVREILRRNHGVLLVADAAKVGVSESRLRRLVAANQLRRLGPGVYVDAKGLVAVGEWQRFALKARAFALKCGPDSFLTEWGLHRRPRLLHTRPAAEISNRHPAQVSRPKAVHRYGRPCRRRQHPGGAPVAPRAPAGDQRRLGGHGSRADGPADNLQRTTDGQDPARPCSIRFGSGKAASSGARIRRRSRPK